MGNGLCHNSAISLIQTRDGYIWIGTRDGLCRFDGIMYKIFKTDFDNRKSISNNSVNTLFEDSNGFLWIGTTMGLNRYSSKNDEFDNFVVQSDRKTISHNYIRAIAETSDGNILIGSPGGIDIFYPKRGVFEKMPCETYLQTTEKNVFCFLRDSKERIWVGKKNGLYRIRNDSLVRSTEFNTKSFGFLNQEIRDIKEDKSGTMWIATEWAGLFSVSFLNNNDFIVRQFTVANSDLVSDHVRNIIIRENEIWIGTLEGLSILNPSNLSFTNYQYSQGNTDGLGNNSIRDLLVDNQGGIWVATYSGGVNYYHPQNNLFPHYLLSGSDQKYPATSVVAGFLEEPDGNLWIATEGSGLVFTDSKRNELEWYIATEAKNSLVNNNIKSLVRDQSGNLWIGTNGGLSYFDRKASRFTNYGNISGVTNSLSNNQIHSLYLLGDSLWIGTNGGGVQVFNTRRKQFSTILLQGVKNVNVLFADNQGHLWIGHQAGLTCMNLKTSQPVDLNGILKKIPVSIQYVQSLYQDKSGRIWIGTQGYGLFYIHGDTARWINTSQGLPDNTINAITEDAAQNLWLSSNKGLIRISFQNGNPAQISTFTKNQGLQELQFLPGSVLRSKSGEILFGGINGYNRFEPQKIAEGSVVPQFRITSFSSGFIRDNRIVTWPLNQIYNNKELKLSYRTRNITINFLEINYIDPLNTYYRYKLVRSMTNWSSPTTERSITFNYLPAGEYTFMVQASTNPGVWTNDYKTIYFRILPPWWETQWAFAGYILALMLMLTLFFHLTKRWITLNNQLKMEHFQREKEEELHRLKLEFFTDISHELRTPLTLISAPLEEVAEHNHTDSQVASHLSLIRQNVDRMTQLITSFLDLQRLDAGIYKLNVSEHDLTDFLDKISKPFAENAAIRHIDFQVFMEISPYFAWFDRDKMETILYNLLSNALKNTLENGKIILSLITSGIASNNGNFSANDQFEISVWNSGKGISEELQKRIFERFFISDRSSTKQILGSGIGLELSRRLAGLHHGFISVDSVEQTQDNEGFTCFRVLLPKGKKHYQPDEIINVNVENDPEISSVRLNLTNFTEFEKSQAQYEQVSETSDERNVVLIVEDNRELKAFIKSILSEKYSVEEAENGKRGFEKALETVPDLIISDIKMPEMDGFELCKKIKTDMRTSHIPVILLTALSGNINQQEGLESGADDYVTKPFHSGILLLRIRNILRQRDVLRAKINLELICEPLAISAASSDERLLKKAMDYINRHISDSSLNVETLAGELGLSRVHLYRKLKALTNLSAVEFIRNIRLKTAGKLLRENKFNISEISLMAGFSDSDYFRDCFKELYGMTPNDYRKNQML